ncbi:unnamed protein product [Trichobilharzia regenti]|nr:unnamed protein product [Trichobilharzia regenti]
MDVEYNILRYYLDDIPTGLLFIDGLALVIRTISYNIFLILWYKYIPEINMLGQHLWCKLMTQISAKCRLIFRRSFGVYFLRYASKSHHHHQQLSAYSRRRRQRRRRSRRQYPYLSHSVNRTSYRSDQSIPRERNLSKPEYYYAKMMNLSKEGLETLKSGSKLNALLRRRSSSKQLD